MVPGFHRSISLPLSPSRSFKTARAAASYHIRSVSLPCRTHPLISHLEDQIRAVRSWLTTSDVGSSIWIVSSLAQIEALQTSIKEFLQLSQTQEILRHASSIETLLEDFLTLADIYGSFVSAVNSLKQLQSDVQSAIRRADKACLASAVRSQKQVEKEISQLVFSLKNVSRNHLLLNHASDGTEADKIAAILEESVRTTATASAAAFSGVIGLVAMSAKKFKKLGFGSNLAKSAVEELGLVEKLEDVEVCVRNVESGSERVFRSLIGLRVSLLNISTPSFCK